MITRSIKLLNRLFTVIKIGNILYFRTLLLQDFARILSNDDKSALYRGAVKGRKLNVQQGSALLQ